MEAIDVILELGTRQAAAPTDVHRTQRSGLDEPVDGCAPDPQHLSGFFWRQQQRIAGQPLVRGCGSPMSATVEEEAPANLQFGSEEHGPSAVGGRPAGRVPPSGTGELLEIGVQYTVGAPVMWARRR